MLVYDVIKDFLHPLEGQSYFNSTAKRNKTSKKWIKIIWNIS